MIISSHGTVNNVFCKPCTWYCFSTPIHSMDQEYENQCNCAFNGHNTEKCKCLPCALIGCAPISSFPHPPSPFTYLPFSGITIQTISILISYLAHFVSLSMALVQTSAINNPLTCIYRLLADFFLLQPHLQLSPPYYNQPEEGS